MKYIKVFPLNLNKMINVECIAEIPFKAIPHRASNNFIIKKDFNESTKLKIIKIVGEKDYTKFILDFYSYYKENLIFNSHLAEKDFINEIYEFRANLNSYSISNSYSPIRFPFAFNISDCIKYDWFK